MTVWLLLLAPLLMPVQAPQPRGLEGLWLSTIQAGPTTLRLGLHVTREPNGLSGKLDSIDQGAFGLPLSSISEHAGKVKFELKTLGISFEGALDNDALSGQWRQGGFVAPLVFKRVEKLPEIVRPQEPKKPYPYSEEEVSYVNAKAGIRFAGTLTLPSGAGPHPAALLITGSGPQDRNESIAGHKPFLVLADYLTRRGIAVLRVDDRGVGGSGGKPDEGTTEDFAGDALAGVAYLKSRKEIDARRIGLVGHSEGGLVAPLAAAQSPDVAFIVLMAGPGVVGEKILEAQGELILRAMGVPQEIAARNRQLQRLTFDVLKQEKDNAAAQRKIREGAAKMKAGLSADQQKGMDALIARMESQLKFVSSAWFRAFLSYDPRPALMKVKAPVLAASGERDLQVPPQQNLPAIAEALEAGGNRDYTLVKLPGLNHLFQTSQNGSPVEYPQIEETIAPAALQVVGDWILRHAGK